MSSLIGAGIAGCDDDELAKPGGGTDSGVDQQVTDSPPGDTMVTPDTSVDSGVNARITVMHASPDFPPMRICFAIRFGSLDVVAAVPPGPDAPIPGLPFPGIFPGTGGVFPDFKDLSSDTIVVYGVFADRVKDNVKGGTQKKCADYINVDGGTALTKNVDYVEFPPLPAGTFSKNSSQFVAVTGCLPKAADPNASPEKCGSNYVDATGNLALTKVEVDKKTAVSSAQLGAQFIHLSQPLQTLAPTGVLPAFVLEDGGVVPITTAPVQFGKIGPATATGFAIDPAKTALGLVAPNDAGVLTVQGQAAPLNIVRDSTIGPGGPANYFRPGVSYAFVAIGDPTIPPIDDAGVPNGYGLHFLGLLSDPTPPTP